MASIFDRPMVSSAKDWRRDWFEHAPRDARGTSWWVYFEVPTRRWLAYGIRNGTLDCSEPLSAKTFPDAVIEMYERIGVERGAHEAALRKLEKESRQKQIAEQQKRQERRQHQLEIRNKLGLGTLGSLKKLPNEVPFANRAIRCPICEVPAGEACISGNGKKRATTYEWVRHETQLQFQDDRLLEKQFGQKLRNLPCHLRVEVSHRERRELYSQVCPSRSSAFGLLPASVGIASLLSLDLDT